MGACASVTKAMRGEATAAPPPEPPKEETPATVAVEVTAVKEDGGDDKKEEKVVEENDKAQSLGTLLDKGEAAKEADSKSTEKESQKPKADVLQVPETTAVAPPAVAEVAAEKKPEEAEQK
ncbi:hypothetical protein BUALT_Bualt19G0090700 [Buddleja alternifolia]|uniref:Uncharacterized protein n=1 Tax=Buddleja alternifolia TaxID=168488 RepID=A0AAV6W6C1_9LAMI|nr:hypothetical protein BUALT_Bualt19G0090700 [Buddleja alternifolia]